MQKKTPGPPVVAHCSKWHGLCYVAFDDALYADLLHQTPTKVNSTYVSELSRQSRRAAGYKWPDYPRRDAKSNQTLFNAFSINTYSQVPYRTVPTRNQHIIFAISSSILSHGFGTGPASLLPPSPRSGAIEKPDHR